MCNVVDEAMVKFKSRSFLKQYMPRATDSPEKNLGIKAVLHVTRDVFNKGIVIICFPALT